MIHKIGHWTQCHKKIQCTIAMLKLSTLGNWSKLVTQTWSSQSECFFQRTSLAILLTNLFTTPAPELDGCALLWQTNLLQLLPSYLSITYVLRYMLFTANNLMAESSMTTMITMIAICCLLLMFQLFLSFSFFQYEISGLHSDLSSLTNSFGRGLKRAFSALIRINRFWNIICNSPRVTRLLFFQIIEV